MSDRYAAALAFAAWAHQGQTRKGTTIPYITHPVAVSELVARYGGDEDQMIAALFHDVLEDCPHVPPEQISDEFGARVLSLVKALTDGTPDHAGRKAPWRERKEAYLAHLAHAPDDVILVSACDKLHNARCIVQDLKDGVDVFERFTAKMGGTLWYYATLAKIFRDRLGAESLLAGAMTEQVASMLRLSGDRQAA